MTHSSTGTYDTVVVGAGHNILVAAAYLAKAGHSVLVLEKNAHPGGVVTQEVTAPGFKHELHGQAMSWILANPVLANDELGLLADPILKPVILEDPAFSGLFDDGAAISVYPSLDKTCGSLARFSQKDAETYRSLTLRNMKMLDFIKFALFRPPMNMPSMMKLMEGSTDGRALANLMTSSAYEVIERNFENAYVKNHFYRWVIEVTVSPESAGTGLDFMLLSAMAHGAPFGVFKGGNQRLADALINVIERNGGELRFNSCVNKLNVSDGRINSVTTSDGETIHARKTVVASIPPWELPKMAEGVDKARLGDIDGLRHSMAGCFLTHYALNEAPRYIGGDDEFSRSFFCYYLKNDLNRYRRCIDAYKFGDMPDYFCGQAVVPTHLDPSRAPDGKHVMYFYHYVPPSPEGKGSEHWQHIEEDFANWMLKGAQGYITNLTSSNIVGRSIESPYSQQRHSASFRHGDVYGIAMSMDQMMGQRPTKELANYQVPGVDGLYLCGPFMHPGGGVIGGGRPVAMKIMMDLGMNLRASFASL